MGAEERREIWGGEGEEGGSKDCTCDFKGLPRLGLYPFAIDITDIRLQQRRIFQLKFQVSKLDQELSGSG
jgi:hypothetical protein